MSDRHNDQRGVVGHGAEAFAAVGEGLLSFAIHRGTFPRVTTSASRAAPGVEVAGHVGPFATSCRVVSVVETDRVRGFTYRTLPGNPVRGEEQFTVTLREDGDVELRLQSVSRPAGLPALAPPLVRLAQAIANRRYFAAARRLSAS